MSDILEAGNIRCEQSLVRFQRLRLAVINARRVDAHRINLALDKEPSRSRIDSREMQQRDRFRSGLIGPEIFEPVRPTGSPSGPHQDDGSHWYLSVLLRSEEHTSELQ